LETLRTSYVVGNKDFAKEMKNNKYCGGAVVESLRYKPEGRGIDSQWCQWNFSMKYSFQPHHGPGVDSTSNRNEYQVYFLG
jgi:hypothetical protein